MNLIANPWNVVYFVGFIAYLRIRGVYAHRCARVEKIHRYIGPLERALLVFTISGSLLPPLFYLFTPLLSVADYTAPPFVPCCGLVAMLTALWLFWRSHRDLGDNWSVSLEVRRDHNLVTNGVYRFIRHPMYSSLWLWSIAQALLLPNWLAGPAGLVTFAPMYFLRTPREERMMCDHFGDEYRHYMKRTGRLWPRLRF